MKQPGNKMKKNGQVNLDDIAGQCGLSRATVGHILGGQNRYKFKKETVELVRNTAEKMNYRPNQFAAALRKQENKIILCIVGDVCRYSDVQHLKYLEYELGKRGYNLLVQFLVDLPEKMKLDFIEKLINWPAGIAIWSLGILEPVNMERFNRLFTKAPPTLGLNMEFPGTKIDYIRILWGKHLIELAALHFSQKHFRKVGCCLHLGDSEEIGRSFREAVHAEGMEATLYKPDKSIHNRHFFEAGKNIAEKIMKARDLPQALYCISDEMAFSIIEEFRANGIRVPEDVYFLGGGDSEFCQYLHKPLPILIHDIHALAEAAAVDLVTRIERGDTVVGTGRCIAELSRRIYNG